MFLELLTLAQTATPPADTSGSIITGFVVAVIGAVCAGVANIRGKKAGRAETLKVEPQPLAVKLEDHFVTRREFDDFKTSSATNFTEVKGLMIRLTERVDAKHSELLATIERAARTGTDGRVHLWEDLKKYKDKVADDLKHQGERIAKVEAGVDIAGRFERVATEAFKPKPTRG